MNIVAHSKRSYTLYLASILSTAANQSSVHTTLLANCRKVSNVRLRPVCIALFFTLIIQPAHASLLNFIHDVGDYIEEKTGIDLDWQDDLEHVIEQTAEELCELMGFELGKNCHLNGSVSVNNNGEFVDLDGQPIYAEASKSDGEDVILIRNTHIQFDEEDLDLTPNDLSEIFGSRLPASENTLISSPRHPGNTPSPIPNIGALLSAAQQQIEISNLTRESRVMGYALSKYAATLPKGEADSVIALYKHKKFIGVYPSKENHLVEDIRLYDKVGPLTIYGTNLQMAIDKGYKCDSSGNLCVPPEHVIELRYR